MPSGRSQRRSCRCALHGPALQVLTGANYHRELEDDPERCEWFVPVQWLHTVPLEKGVREIDLFGNQNTVCRPTTTKWRTTVERLRTLFPAAEAPPGTAPG